jgi:hypothetical protein
MLHETVQRVAAKHKQAIVLDRDNHERMRMANTKGHPPREWPPPSRSSSAYSPAPRGNNLHGCLSSQQPTDPGSSPIHCRAWPTHEFDCWINNKSLETSAFPFLVWRTHLHNNDAKFPVPQDPIDTSSPTEPVHLELCMPESTNQKPVLSLQFAGRLERDT